jgi:hypothetical protein
MIFYIELQEFVGLEFCKYKDVKECKGLGKKEEINICITLKQE